MIDYIKSLDISADIEKLSDNLLLEFEGKHNVRTGEINETRQKSKYKDMTIEIVQNRYINMFGSLHKCSNNGLHNHNDFTFEALIDIVIDLCQQCNLNPFYAPLNNLEFGVNINTDIAPKSIISQNIINYKGKQPGINTFGGKGYLKEFILNQYIVKIYDKGMQFNQAQNIFRFEIKVLKMEYLKKIRIYKLSDLLDIHKLIGLGKLMDEVFSNLLMYDNDVDFVNLPVKEQMLIQNGVNPIYWENLLPDSSDYVNGNQNPEYKKDRKTYYSKLEQFKKLVNKYNSNTIKQDLAQKINSKWNELLTINENTRDKLTTFLNSFSNSKKGQIDHVATNSKNEQKGQINTSNIVSDCPKQKKVCLVTGLDISMQKESSRFLCVTGINYYKKEHPEIFRELKKRVSSKWNKDSKETEIEAIHHSVRNEFNNPRNNTKRSINNLLSQPSLFNNWDLIDKKKLKIAGMI